MMRLVAVLVAAAACGRGKDREKPAPPPPPVVAAKPARVDARAGIEARVKKIVAAELGVSEAMVPSNARLYDLGSNFDQWAHLGVALEVEREFKLRIEAPELDKLQTVDDFVDYIAAHQ